MELQNHILNLQGTIDGTPRVVRLYQHVRYGIPTFCYRLIYHQIRPMQNCVGRIKKLCSRGSKTWMEHRKVQKASIKTHNELHV
jgi:hypothetical protein